MKAFLLTSLVLLTSTLAQASEIRPLSQDHEYSIDKRYVDGNLTVIKVIKRADGLNDIVRVVTTAGFGAPVQTSDTVLLEGATCDSDINELPVAEICSRDDRFVDGNRVEISFASQEDGKFYAVKKITTAGFGAPVETHTVVLAKNLKLSDSAK